MALLSRTASKESNASSQTSQHGLAHADVQDTTTDVSGPPSPTNASKSPQPLNPSNRVSSHSLLSAPQNANIPSRKSRFADAGTANESVGRASISMPPPATKPSSIYRPSTVRHPTGSLGAVDRKELHITLDGAAEEKALGDGYPTRGSEKSTSPPGVDSPEPHSPSAASDSGLKPSGLNKPGDRLSFSSLHSLGPGNYNAGIVSTSAPPSAASSTAGSVRSIEQPTPTITPMSPPLGSTATTVTDPVSVTANSQPSHQGEKCVSCMKPGPFLLGPG